MEWRTTKEGYILWCDAGPGLDYSWKGDVFANLINGKGVLTIVDSSGNIQHLSLDAYYGAFSQNKAIKTSRNEYYIGKVENGKYSDFSVLIKGDDVYVGNFHNGKPSGKLTLFRSNSIFYEGLWSDGTFNGEGTLYCDDGSVKYGIWKNGTLISAEVEIDTDVGRYEGTVLNSKPDGFGRLLYKKGAEYEGEWKNGVWHGLGQYIVQNDTIISEWNNGCANGNTVVISGNTRYEGKFSNNLPNGNGGFYDMNPESHYIYVGEWYNGLRHGYGDVIYSNGDSYYGEWQENKYHGVGRYRYANGDIYDGEWIDNLPNGKGQYLSDSFTYRGEWTDGWIHGFGRLDFANGDIYEGDFCEGKKSGIGLYQFSNGNVYEGEFNEDQINGLGVLTFSDGNRYEGEFLNGKIYGNGTLYYTDTTGIVTLTAFWDKPNEFPTEASIVFPNGDCYEGPLLNGRPSKEGNWYKIDAKTGKSIIIDKLSSFNDYYERHNKTFNKIVIYTSLALTVIEVVGIVAAPFTGGASLTISSVAKTANLGLNVIDVGTSVTHAGINIALADNSEEERDAIIALGSEVAINSALLLVPKALKAGPVQKITSKLTLSAKNAVRESVVKLSKKSAFAKVISIARNKTNKAILALEKTVIGGKYLRVTGKPSYQYITDEQVQKIVKNNPNLKIQYNPDASGSGKILGDNTLQFMSEKARRRYHAERRIMGARRAQWHHAIAGNKNNPSAEECRRILKKFQIDINDPRNAILLPVEPKSIMKGTLHGKHVNSYDDYVLNRLKQANTTAQCLEIMDDIKKSLYKGQLQLLIDHRVNTALRTVTRKSTY